MKLLEKFNPRISEEKEITVEEVIENSMSWKNIIKSRS